MNNNSYHLTGNVNMFISNTHRIHTKYRTSKICCYIITSHNQSFVSRSVELMTNEVRSHWLKQAWESLHFKLSFRCQGKQMYILRFMWVGNDYKRRDLSFINKSKTMSHFPFLRVVQKEFICIYPTIPPQAGCNTRSILKQSTTGLKSFSF